jgi:hygromycin-B 4-O-kinase
MAPSPPAVDVEQAASLLRDRLGTDVTDLEPLQGGAWSRAFAFQGGGTPLVVRFSSVEGDFRNDERAARFASAALPIPRIHEIGTAWDGWYAISDRVNGTYLEETDERTMSARLPSLFAVLDALRDVDVADRSGFGGWQLNGDGPHPSWRASLLEIGSDQPALRIHGWTARLADRPGGGQLFESTHRELERVSADLPEVRHAVHSDLINRNVLCVGARITGVLDWGSAVYGDHLYDLAWIVFWGPFYPGWGELDVLGQARRHYREIGLEVTDFERRLRACQLHIALDGMRYQAWAAMDDTLAWTMQRTRMLLDQRP